MAKKHFGGYDFEDEESREDLVADIESAVRTIKRKAAKEGDARSEIAIKMDFHTSAGTTTSKFFQSVDTFESYMVGEQMKRSLGVSDLPEWWQAQFEMQPTVTVGIRQVGKKGEFLGMSSSHDQIEFEGGEE